MNRAYYGVVFLCTIVAGLSIIWYSGDLPGSPIRINAQGHCIWPSAAPIVSRWPAQTVVTVKIHNAFTQNEETK